MADVITEPCIDVKDRACLDGGAGEPVRPVEAISLEDASRSRGGASSR